MRRNYRPSRSKTNGGRKLVRSRTEEAESAKFDDELECATVGGATISPSISSSRRPSRGGIVLEALPSPPSVRDTSIKLNDANFEPCELPNRLKNSTERHSKCREAFGRERTRANAAVKEAERQNRFANEYQSALKQYAEKSQTFMIRQQEYLKAQSEKIGRLTNANKQLTDEATALKLKVEDLKKELGHKKPANNSELEGKIVELTQQLKDSKKEYRLQLGALLHVVQMETKRS